MCVRMRAHVLLALFPHVHLGGDSRSVPRAPMYIRCLWSIGYCQQELSRRQAPHCCPFFLCYTYGSWEIRLTSTLPSTQGGDPRQQCG